MLDYYQDISFNAFLYPDVKTTRKLLSFMFEFIFKNEASNGPKQQEAMPTNEFEQLIKRRLMKWTKKPWMLPDFLKDQKKQLLVGGEVI